MVEHRGVDHRGWNSLEKNEKDERHFDARRAGRNGRWGSTFGERRPCVKRRPHTGSPSASIHDFLPPQRGPLVEKRLGEIVASSRPRFLENRLAVFARRMSLRCPTTAFAVDDDRRHLTDLVGAGCSRLRWSLPSNRLAVS